MSTSAEVVAKTDKKNILTWINMLIAGTVLIVIEILLAQVVSGLGALLLLPFGIGAYVLFIAALVLSVVQSKKDGIGKVITNFLVALVITIGVLAIGGSIL